jgi:hypothetical protein
MKKFTMMMCFVFGTLFVLSGGGMLMPSPMVGWILLGIGGYIKWSSRAIFNDKFFQQEGVAVDFGAGTITIKGNTKPVSAVQSFYTLKSETRASKVSVEWDDMKTPVHEFAFFSQKAADEFVSRLKQAIKKAGGPTYS